MMDIGASLRFKWRAPFCGAMPGESLKSYARRLAASPREDAAVAREWLRRKGCTWQPEAEPVRGARLSPEHLTVFTEGVKKSDLMKAWRNA